MIRWGFILARIFVAVVCLLTWAFGLIVSVRFAYEQFIRPQLFPWVTEFVSWHHAWYWAALLVSVATIVPQLRLLAAKGVPPIAAWLSLGYVVCFGAIGIYLLSNPYLAGLDGGTRSIALVPGALVPLLWLAAIDHTGGSVQAALQRRDVTGQQRLLDAALATAISLWLIHVLIAALRPDLSGGWTAWVVTSMWALVLDVTAGAALALLLGLGAAVAATRPRSFAWEYALCVVLLAGAAIEFIRRLVLPSLTFTGVDAAISAVPLGATLALMWSGWRIRQRPRELAPDTAIAFLTSLFDGRSKRSLVVCLVPIGAAIASRLVETVDWALIMNRLIAVTEAALVFGFFLSRFRERQDGRWSAVRLIATPLAGLLVLWMLPWATLTAGAMSHNPQLDSELALDRLPTTDPIGATIARLWVEQQAPDVDYYREMIASNTTQSAARPIVPATSFSAKAFDINPRPPHVFIFLIDSLRRDYLSTYNPAVTFTPQIESFARDSYVFSNAFTIFGGTWMAIPSMWSGTALTRGWGQIFKQINVIEPLVASANYDLAINDYTVEMELQPQTQRTFLNPGITSVNTDLCDNVAALQSHIERRTSSERPLFAFLAPMNVHILNTRGEAGPDDPRYAGFYRPYAARLERLDGCFGSFVAYLKQHDLYDNSIIIVSADHGDTLGTDGNWGHQFFLFPEDIRIPLIVHLPPALRGSVTTDLARVALLPDIAPTLLNLLGAQVADLPPPFAAPLFAAADSAPKPRRRESFLVMSSYGSTYALLRRNGRFLYISDLVSWREYAYTLFKQPNGERVPVTDWHRRIGQSGIRAHLKTLDALYRKQ